MEYSDEELMNMTTPPSFEENEEEQVEQQEQEEEVTEVTSPAEDEQPSEETSGEVKEEKDHQEQQVETSKESVGADYESFYKKVMAPFQANGKTIQLNSPEEAIQLMQMGANYTRKMQAMAPHRKLIMMLENNKIDEGRLNYLIDLSNQKPEAVKKLVIDSKIDPLDIDTGENHTYQAGDHGVSDEEVRFKSVLDDVEASAGGDETLRHINAEWDRASKEMLWSEPEVIKTIHEQRQSGIYQKVADEVSRQKMLGNISAETPFIQAYQLVGDALHKAGAFNPVKAPVAKPAKKSVDNARAAATAPTRSKPAKIESASDMFNLSDEEFLKRMANRV